jgi:hypothetical protein
MYQSGLRHAAQLLFNLGQSRLKSCAAMRIRRTLVQNLLTLQLQRLAPPLSVRGLGRGLLMLLRCALAVSLPVRKLFLDRFALPTSRHTLMLLPIPVRS